MRFLILVSLLGAWSPSAQAADPNLEASILPLFATASNTGVLRKKLQALDELGFKLSAQSAEVKDGKYQWFEDQGSELRFTFYVELLPTATVLVDSATILENQMMDQRSTLALIVSCEVDGTPERNCETLAVGIQTPDKGTFDKTLLQSALAHGEDLIVGATDGTDLPSLAAAIGSTKIGARLEIQDKKHYLLLKAKKGAVFSPDETQELLCVPGIDYLELNRAVYGPAGRESSG